VGTYSAWESTATLGLLGGALALRRPRGQERGGGILCRHAHSLFLDKMHNALQRKYI